MWWKKALICRSSKLDVCSGSPQNWNFTLYYKTLDIFEALPYRTCNVVYNFIWSKDPHLNTKISLAKIAFLLVFVCLNSVNLGLCRVGVG